MRVISVFRYLFSNSDMTTEEFCGMTLAELEARSKVSQGRWSLYLNKKQAPTFRTISVIAERLKMSPEQLVKAMNQKSVLGMKRGRRRLRVA